MAHTKVTKTHSQNTGVANTFSYSGSFDVFKGAEVIVTLDAVALTFTSSTINESASPREYTVDTAAKTIHIGGADLSSGTIIIRPQTDMGSPTPRATYTPGASITSEDLNNNQLQLLRKAMEYDDTKMSTTGDTMTGHLTMGEDTTIIFEGATDDGYETTLTVADPDADRTITLPNVTGTVVTTGDTGTVTATMLAADSVDSSELVDGSIDTSHIGANQVTSGKLANDAVTGAQLADDAVDSEHYTDGSIDTAHIADSQITADKLASSAVTTAKINADAVTGAKIADDAIDSEHYADGSIDTAHIANSQVTTAKIADDAVTFAKIGCEQTTISDTDTSIPTSGAVVDYVAAQIAPIGGLEVIATDAAFPNTQPASGVVISIADAGGLVVNGSGVSTTGRTVGASTVTINGINSSFHSTTIDAGIGMLVTSTGSGQIYDYHKTVIKEADVAQISDDINDFNSRYRIASSAPGSNNDEGDLYFDTTANKMYVHDGSAWGQVTSTGEFKILSVKDNGQAHDGSGPTFNGSNDQFDLFEGTSDASITQAAQLIVSLNGVVQKPNDGSWSGSEEGFYLDGADGIRFCDPPASGSSLFVIKCGSANDIGVPGDNTVTAAKTDISIVQGDVIYGNGTDSWTRLAKGTAGQVLKMNSGATAPEWGSAADATKLPLAGGTITGDVIFDNATNAGQDMTWDMSDNALEFTDNTKIVLGTGGDYKISFNSSNAIFENDSSNTGGDVYFYQDDLYIGNVAKDETVAAFKSDGACELYYDNVKEFETKSGGVTLNGCSNSVINHSTNVSGSTTLDFSLADHHIVSLTGNATLANPSTEVAGQSGSIFVEQDGTGSRTLAYGNNFKWVGGTAPTLSTAANAVDRIDYIVRATDSIHCVISLDIK